MSAVLGVSSTAGGDDDDDDDEGDDLGVDGEDGGNKDKEEEAVDDADGGGLGAATFLFLPVFVSYVQLSQKFFDLYGSFLRTVPLQTL